MTGPLLAVAVAFVMEPVAASVHRWLGHGPLWFLHRDHHEPGPGRWERNDLIPLGFAALSMVAFALALSRPHLRPLVWVAIGVTGYGISYALVHDVYIHRRIPLLPRRIGWLEPLRRAHLEHHRTGGAPFGVLIPLRARARRPPRTLPGGPTNPVSLGVAAPAVRVEGPADARRGEASG